MTIAGEAKPLFCQTSLQQCTEPWLKKGDIAVLNAGDSVAINIHADHIVTHLREYGCLH
jgi:hypothetical protein